MEPKLIKNIIFVDGADPTEIWYRVAASQNLDNQCIFVNSIGINLEANFVDLIFLIENIQNPNYTIHYFVLVNDDEPGRALIDQLKVLAQANQIKLPCYTLKSLFNHSNHDNDNLTIQDLLYNQFQNRIVPVDRFLTDYPINPQHYPYLNQAWSQWMNILKLKNGTK